MHHHLNTLYQGQSLSRESTRDAFGQVVRGEVDPIVLASLLTALKIKGETPEEIAGAAEALLAEARDFPRPDYEFCDIVGTGGDGLNTINVSTTSALVATYVPEELTVIAHYQGMPMAIEQQDDRVLGFQFHPESIMTSEGARLLTQALAHICRPDSLFSRSDAR